MVDAAMLDIELGLVGDSWVDRGSKRMADGSSDREAQVTIMNSRVAALLSDGPIGWEIAGDQLYVDLDLSMDNLPPGSAAAGRHSDRGGLCRARIEAVSSSVPASVPMRCASPAPRPARALRLRGVNTRVVESGIVRTGDETRKL